MKIKQQFINGAILLLLTNPVFAENSNAQFNSTATVNKTCSIEAESISFGVLSMPLSMQTSNSEMNILCNKDTSYTIDLAYGGVYGQGTGEVLYWMVTSETVSNGFSASILRQFNSQNVATGKQEMVTTAYINSFLYNNYGCVMVNGKCSYTEKSYSYGKMIGGIKKNSIGYAILVPNETTKIWNVGQNSYKNIGTGSMQTIPINAHIVPNQSSVAYPAADIYSDTITATISY